MPLTLACGLCPLRIRVHADRPDRLLVVPGLRLFQHHPRGGVPWMRSARAATAISSMRSLVPGMGPVAVRGMPEPPRPDRSDPDCGQEEAHMSLPDQVVLDRLAGFQPGYKPSCQLAIYPPAETTPVRWLRWPPPRPSAWSSPCIRSTMMCSRRSCTTRSGWRDVSCRSASTHPRPPARMNGRSHPTGIPGFRRCRAQRPARSCHDHDDLDGLDLVDGSPTRQLGERLPDNQLALARDMRAAVAPGPARENPRSEPETDRSGCSGPLR